ncbi:ABC transporter permease [soil metagenome]
MSRWLGLWRPVAGRARSDWQFLLAIWLLIVSATTLLTAGALYAETVEAGGLRRALAEAPAESRGASVRTLASGGELVDLDLPIRTELEAAFGPAGVKVARIVRSATLQLIGPATGEAPRLTSLGAYEGLADHSRLVQGRWPEAGQQPIEAALSARAAERLFFRLGDRLGLADASTPGADPTVAIAEVEIVGLYEVEPDDPFWLGDAQETEGVVERDRRLYIGPLMIEPADAADSPGFARAEATWRALPVVAGLRTNLLVEISSRLDGLRTAIARAMPDSRAVTINTDLAAVLRGVDRSALVSRGGVVLLTLQFWILAGYAVLLAGGILAERRRAEVALLRARGAASAEVSFIALGEACLLVLPAALVAPLLAAALVWLVGSVGALAGSGIIVGAELGATTFLVALASGAACVVALTLPALIAEIDLARVRAALGRPLAQTTAQRLGLDLVLLVLAAIGLVQLRSYGTTLTPSTGGRLELDPLLVAAPAIALAAGAVMVVRFVPRIGELAQWLVRRRPDVLAPYAARQAARRPLRYTRSALLIVMAAALGTFGALYSATWAQSQADQAAYQAGAEMRVVRAPHQAGRAAEIGDALAGLDGVQQVTSVVRAGIDGGRAIRAVNLIAVDPEILAQVAGLPVSAAEARTLLAGLAADRPAPPSVELPAEARRLSVVLNVDIQQSGSHGLPIDLATFPGVQVLAVIDTGGLDPTRLPAQLATFGAGEQRLVFDLPAVEAGAGTMRLLAVDMTIGSPVMAVGELAMVRIEASASSAGDDWNSVVEASALADWSIVYHPNAARPNAPFGRHTHDYGGPLVVFNQGDPVPSCEQWSFGDSASGCHDPFQDLLRWSSATAYGPVPAIASDSLLQAGGSAIGERVTINWFSAFDVEITGSVATFPSLDPNVPFLIVDRGTINTLRSLLQIEPMVPSEWWLRVAEEQLANVEAAAAAPAIAAAEVISSATLARTLQRDPLALGLVGALLLGSIAAASFAALGLVVTAVVSARERVGEVGLLRALGLSRREVLAMISAEQGALLGLGLLSGAALGWLMALLVLPHAPFNRSGAAPVPTPEIVVPWGLAVLVILGGALVVAVGVLAARGELVGRPVVDVLREREE